MMYAATEDTRFMHQLAALMIALALFTLIWIAAAILIQALDFVRGLDTGWIQYLLRHFVAPWMGGFLGVAIGLHWFRRSSAKFVFFSFSSAILAAIVVYLAAVELPMQSPETSLDRYWWLAFPVGACIFGAYNASHANSFRH